MKAHFKDISFVLPFYIQMYTPSLEWHIVSYQWMAFKHYTKIKALGDTWYHIKWIHSCNIFGWRCSVCCIAFIFPRCQKMMGINYFQLIYYGIRCFKHGNKEGDKEFVMSIAMEWWVNRILLHKNKRPTQKTARKIRNHLLSSLCEC